MSKYLIRTKDGHEEIGWVFVEAEGYVLPPGYIAYSDEVTHGDGVMVGSEDEFSRISKAQYDHIVEHLIRGFDPTEAIQEVLASLGHVQELFDKWQAFKRATNELYRAWEHVPHELEECIGINENYPFEHELGEMVAKIRRWGMDDE